MMIIKNELRLGNWVSHNANWCYRSPSEIKPFDFQWEDRDWYALGESTLNLEDIEPIPLTEEWLEKSGFKESVNKNGWYFIEYLAFENGDEDVDESHSSILSHLVEISLNTKSFRVNILNKNDDEQGATPKPKIKYVHQLQNLIFTLTGEELQTKL